MQFDLKAHFPYVDQEPKEELPLYKRMARNFDVVFRKHSYENAVETEETSDIDPELYLDSVHFDVAIREERYKGSF